MPLVHDKATGKLIFQSLQELKWQLRLEEDAERRHMLEAIIAEEEKKQDVTGSSIYQNQNPAVDSISIPTPWGQPLIARGSMVILVLLFFAAIGFTAFTNQQRSQEHQELMHRIDFQTCVSKLN